MPPKGRKANMPPSAADMPPSAGDSPSAADMPPSAAGDMPPSAAGTPPRRSNRAAWAVLAAGALVASLLAVGAPPAAAQTRPVDTAEHLTDLSACVGEEKALKDQKFSDVTDKHAHRDAINCIAYYGITLGTGDGSTFSPYRPVTRAQMAVFIARAARIAVYDLAAAPAAAPDAPGFTDIGGVWQEAQDAINLLVANEMIRVHKSGEFRPHDPVTRAEMATFLIGLLVEAAPNVKIDPHTGDILLGDGRGKKPNDYFADARAKVPIAIDQQIAALFELGVTKGASPAAVRDDTKPPLDYNYQPLGTVNRGQMAEFITRALAHTSVRPAGVTVQYEDDEVHVSVRDEDFQLRPNVVVDVFHIDTEGADLAFESDGTCDEVEVGRVGLIGAHVCEIDGTDLLTGGDGDARLPFPGAEFEEGGTTVWAWTGEEDDTVDGDTGLFRLDIPEEEDDSKADRVRVSTEFIGDKAHLGSSVLYTVQLEDADGHARNGVDGEKPARFLVRLSTWELVETGGTLGRSLQGPTAVSGLPLTTDWSGKATFLVSGRPDPAPVFKRDKWEVDIQIQPSPGDNAPARFYIGADATTLVSPTTPVLGFVPVKVGPGLVFSTEDSDRAKGKVIVEPAAEFVASDARGAGTRATVTVVDQYGDPIPGAQVSLASEGAPNYVGTTPACSGAGTEAIVIGGGRALAVGRDGAYTFGYERSNAASCTETLEASWDHDGDGCSADDITGGVDRNGDLPGDCGDLDPNTAGDQPGTAPKTGSKMVEWAAAASAAQATGQQIVAFDKETDTIFVDPAAAADDDVLVLYYDSNDRFDINDAGAGDAPASYNEFEKKLSKATGYTLEWGTISRGTRATNRFVLNIPA